MTTRRRLLLLLLFMLVAIPMLTLMIYFRGKACGPGAAEAVRVAAIQCYSDMGETSANVERLVKLVRKAAAEGAKIVVTPEGAIQGYCYPQTWIKWTAGKDAEDEMPVAQFAEPIPGPSTIIFSKLALELKVYLCVGAIEAADGKFYNSQVLFDPQGKIAAHHRKKAMWPPGDGDWCSPGELPVQIVDTEYGRLGLMICYDFQLLPPLLHDAGADIILYSVGWYGPNEKNWFTNLFPRKAIIPYGHHVVSANWCGRDPDDDWPGRGYSCVISKSGEILALNDDGSQECVVIADLPVKSRKK